MYGHPRYDFPISVTRTTSASRSPCSSSRSRSQSRSPRHDGGVLNLDTKSTKVPIVTVDDEVTAFGKPSPKAKESRFEEAGQSRIQPEHAGSDSVANRKSKKFSPAEDIEARPDHAEPEENGYVNGLEAHHHHYSVARSRKATHKDEPAVDYYAAAKEKPLPHVPKSTIEQLDLFKSGIHKYSGLEPSGLPFPFHITPRPAVELASLYSRHEFPPYLLPPYAASSESTLPFLLNNFGYQPHLFSLPESCYRKEPPKDARPASPPRRSPSKEPPFYPPRVDPSHPNQSSAVAPIH
ncbi:uncharacterized protein LOC135697075 [Ochlerotatus camptorhynchus]|uniref:uncharacterized protein LOC135697075 n=1 Tax=Ochlerotatus camptorhynchus TaxID=644619 RepID=UPI0031CFBD4D